MNPCLTSPTEPATLTGGLFQAQTGWHYESLGRVPTAMAWYDQAVQTLAPAVQVLGDQTPGSVWYCLGWCQVRLSWLTLQNGYPMVAYHWLRQALPSLKAAWEQNPGHPDYQLLLAQAALAMSKLDLVRQVCQQSWENPSLGPIRQYLEKADPAGLAAEKGATKELTASSSSLTTTKALGSFTELIKLIQEWYPARGAGQAVGFPGLSSHETGSGCLNGC